jgi:hypothetical protein
MKWVVTEGEGYIWKKETDKEWHEEKKNANNLPHPK